MSSVHPCWKADESALLLLYRQNSYATTDLLQSINMFLRYQIIASHQQYTISLKFEKDKQLKNIIFWILLLLWKQDVAFVIVILALKTFSPGNFISKFMSFSKTQLPRLTPHLTNCFVYSLQSNLLLTYLLKLCYFSYKIFEGV